MLGRHREQKRRPHTYIALHFVANRWKNIVKWRFQKQHQRCDYRHFVGSYFNRNLFRLHWMRYRPTSKRLKKMHQNSFRVKKRERKKNNKTATINAHYSQETNLILLSSCDVIANFALTADYSTEECLERWFVLACSEWNNEVDLLPPLRNKQPLLALTLFQHFSFSYFFFLLSISIAIKHCKYSES